MKTAIILTFLIFLGFNVNAQDTNPLFDQALADSLGADVYGMKTYVFVILKSGPNKSANAEERNRIFRGHLENIRRLGKEGKLIIAGPFEKNDQDYRGIFIFDVKTVDEVKELLRTDPAIKAGIFDTEIFQWYGSAALPVYLKVHEKIARENP